MVAFWKLHYEEINKKFDMKSLLPRGGPMRISPIFKKIQQKLLSSIKWMGGFVSNVDSLWLQNCSHSWCQPPWHGPQVYFKITSSKRRNQRYFLSRKTRPSFLKIKKINVQASRWETLFETFFIVMEFMAWPLWQHKWTLPSIFAISDYRLSGYI